MATFLRDQTSKIKKMYILSILLLWHVAFCTNCFAQFISAERLQKLFTQTAKNNQSAQQLVQYSYSLLLIEKYDSVSIILNKALQLADGNFSKDTIAKIENNLGLACNRLGAYDLSLQHYHSALKHYEKINDIDNVLMTKIKIGQLYNVINQFKTALKYFDEVLYSLNTQKINVDSNKQYAFALNNKGIAYQNLGKMDSALVFYQTALDIKRKIGNDISTAYTINNIGSVYAEQKNFVKALKYYCW